MTATSVEDATRELIRVLQTEADHFLKVAAALEQAADPGDVLSALHPLGETHLCGKINAFGGKLSVLALLAQEQEQWQRQAQP